MGSCCGQLEGSAIGDFSKDGVKYTIITHQGAGKLGYCSINSRSSLLCPHGQMQVAIGVDQEISAGSDLQREVGSWLTLSAILCPSLYLTHYIFMLEGSKYFVEFFENILMSASPNVKIRSDEYFIFQH